MALVCFTIAFVSALDGAMVAFGHKKGFYISCACAALIILLIYIWMRSIGL